jgi:translocator assembly and maintenance protein 41
MAGRQRRHFTLSSIRNSKGKGPSLVKETGQRIDDSELQSLVDCFPPVVHAFGYGSGVFSQRDNEHGMVDLILVVDSAQEWHAWNLQQNPLHYAWLPRLCGPIVCARLQNTGPGVYFHTHVPLEQKVIKYGAVELSKLQQDLQDWSFLYLAGRLHKPTVVITQNDIIMEMQQTGNLPAALAASLILLTVNNRNNGIQEYSLGDVYQQIAQLSYAGDFRTKVGAEDPHKVHKLVHSPGQMQRFDDLYKDSLRDMEKAGLVNVIMGTERRIEYSDSASPEFFRRLPPQFLRGDTTNLRSSLARIVALAARTQSVKGIVTAGLWRSTQYAVTKLSKGLFRSQS